MPISIKSIAEIRQRLNSGDLNNESAVRQGVVLRLLSEAGFDIWDTNSVKPEETNSGGKRPDFIVRSGIGHFAIELKAANISIGPRDFQQTLNYVGTLGIRYAILTNGRLWIFLDEWMRGRYDQRELFRVSVDDYDDSAFSSIISMSLDKRIWDEGVFSVRARRIRNLIQDPNCPDDERIFYFSTLGVTARAVYNSTYDTWTILSGSMAVNREQTYDSVGRGLVKRRMKLISEGRMTIREDGFLEYVEDIMYTSATLAASDIAGSHRSGIKNNWRDENGNIPDI